MVGIRSFRTLMLAALAAALLAVPAAVAARTAAPDLAASIKDFAFVPTVVVVNVGDTVVWTNDEEVMPHDVTSGSAGSADLGQAFKSEVMLPGQTFSVTFGEPGTYPYICLLHPAMTGVVTVAGQAAGPPTVHRYALATAPSASPAGQVVAGGLINPRGFTFAPDGSLVVAEAGAVPPGFQAPGGPPPPDFRPSTTKTGRISRVDLATGERTTLADGLPSAAIFAGDTLGPTSVAYLGPDLYVAIAAGPAHGWPHFPSGVYLVNPDGTVRLVGNIDAFNLRNPAAFIAPDEEVSNPYDMIAVDGALYVTDGNVNQVHRVVPGQPVGRLADLSVGHPVTTGIARAPDGALTVAELTAVPFPQGAGRVLRVGMDGQVGEAFRGTTAATGVAVAADGTIYVVEHSASLGRPPFFQPGTGRVARVTEGGLQTVVDGLTLPTMARIGPDGALYVADFSVGGDNGEGRILRVDVGAAR